MQPGLDRAVAVKVLTGEFDENRERFFREQRAMGRLTGHPNIVGVLEVGETATGRPYLVMPYHRQGSLDARIRRDGPLGVEDVLRLGIRMAGALETAHRAGVLHRDMKPANILLTDYGEPTLTDFGIAHLAGGFRTATGTVTGSPAFTAPEVLGGDAPTQASDVYGLGATLFCALSGHAAFERRSGEQVVAQFLRITTGPAPDLRERGIPEDMCAVIEAAMSHAPSDRPTAAGLGEQLQRAQLTRGVAVDEIPLPDSGAEQPSSGTTVPAVRKGVSSRSRDRLYEGTGNLPLELTSFVGRRTQVSEIKNLLSRSPLVTLTGIGGVGKSRLALHVARKLQREYAGAVWLVELSDLHDEASLVDVVAATLGLQEQAGRPMIELLVDFLSAREVLLVVDNCEHMIEAVAKLAESLLRACEPLRILATSREALGIGGESVYPVPPLVFPDPTGRPSRRGAARHDAVTLFTQRAAAAVPGFELTGDNWADVVGICARLDGLPLAIELAAARLRTMSAAQVLARLDDRFALLTRGSRNAPTRQQTLRWCIGWSYDLCTTAEQQLWARLSVFAGTFELDAAEDVCGGRPAEPDVPDFLDVLAALVDKSILIREESSAAVRFRFLETVQEFGRQKAEEAGMYPELCRRHRDWYEQLAVEAEAEWISPRQLEWIARLERELPNLRKALQFDVAEADEAGLRIAAALFSFWLLRGLHSEGRRWCDHALSRSSGAPSTDRAKALSTAGQMAAYQGDLEAVAGYVAEIRTLAEQTTDPITDAVLALTDGFTALVTGDPARASTCLIDAVDAFDACGRPIEHSWALISLGMVYELLVGDTQQAVDCFEKALIVTESHGDSMYRSYAVGAMGLAMWRSGEGDRATRMLEESVRLSRLVVNPLVIAICSEILAWIAADKRDAQRAAVLLGAAEGLGRMVGSSSVLFPTLPAYHEECERRTREILGTHAYEDARREGAAMRFDAVVRFALGEQSGGATPADRVSATLTKRERQVADLVTEGLTNKAIAARLVISQRTAQGHVEHILTKLGFTSRAQIAAWAVEQSPDDRV